MDENNKLLETENINDEYIPDELSYDNASFEDVSTEVEAEKEKKSWQRELYEWVSSIAVAVVLAFVINTYCFSLVQVDGPSMQPTLYHGERLVVRKLLYTPDNGDVVIVKSDVLQKYIVKRVIALPGQEIGFDAERNVMVDGEIINEPYIASKQENLYYLYSYPLQIPKKGEVASLEVIAAEMSTDMIEEPVSVSIEGKDGKIYVSGSKFVKDGEFIPGETKYTQDGYFVLGDNRNHSSDSRNLGIIPKEEIVGKAFLRFMPFSEFGVIK